MLFYLHRVKVTEIYLFVKSHLPVHCNFLHFTIYKLYLIFKKWSAHHIKNMVSSPVWCGSVDWMLACEPKSCHFYSQSGHMPGLWARSPVRGMREATDWCIPSTSMFLSLSFSLPFPLSKTKENIFLKKNMESLGKTILKKEVLFSRTI